MADTISEKRGQHPSFVAITEAHQDAIAKAVALAGTDYITWVVNYPAREHVSQRAKSNQMRCYLEARLKEALGIDMNVRVENCRGVFVIAIGPDTLIHLKKQRNPQKICSVPKTLLYARIQTLSQTQGQAQQLPLFKDETQDRIDPADFKHHIAAGYQTNDFGQANGMCLNYQEGQTVVDQIKIDLSKFLENPIQQESVDVVEHETETRFIFEQHSDSAKSESGSALDELESDSSSTALQGREGSTDRKHEDISDNTLFDSDAENTRDK